MTSEHDCRLCGWEYATLDGLLTHIRTHMIAYAVYGTLAAAERERDEARNQLAAARDEIEKLETELRHWEQEIPKAVAHYEVCGLHLRALHARLAASEATRARLVGAIEHAVVAVMSAAWNSEPTTKRRAWEEAVRTLQDAVARRALTDAAGQGGEGADA